MNEWTLVKPTKKRKTPAKKTLASKCIILKPNYNKTNKNERVILESVNSSYSNKGPLKNPRHGQGNRKTEVGCRTFNRFKTKVKHKNPELSIISEINFEVAKSPEKLKNLQFAIRYEALLRKLLPHGSTKGQINALKRVLIEKTAVNQAVSRTFVNSKSLKCTSTPIKKSQIKSYSRTLKPRRL